MAATMIQPKPASEAAKPTREPFVRIDLTGLRCPDCGYNLTGLVAAECPECGEPFDPLTVAAQQDSNWWAEHWLPVTLTVAATAAVVAGFVFLDGPYAMIFQGMLSTLASAAFVWLRNVCIAR